MGVEEKREYLSQLKKDVMRVMWEPYRIWKGGDKRDGTWISPPFCQESGSSSKTGV